MLEEFYLKALKPIYESHADPHYGEAMSKYMRYKFPYLGLKSPLRKEYQKEIMNAAVADRNLDMAAFVELLWEEECREYQYFAMEYLEKTKRRWTSDTIELLEYILMRKQWWDTVDAIASNHIGYYYSGKISNPIDRIPDWRKHDNFWMNRVCIIFQLKYKDKIDLQLLESVILEHAHSREFFIQKAIGWALRQHAKTDADWVEKFVLTHQDNLAPLSKREALKHIKH